MADTALTIGQVAKQAGIRTSKIRYYESVGLLKAPARLSGRRTYSPDVIAALSVIQFAQDAGFSIPEIRHVLAGFDRTTPVSKRWQSVASRKLQEVRTLIDRARKMEAILERLVACDCIKMSECLITCGDSAPIGIGRSLTRQRSIEPALQPISKYGEIR
jgi:MerR family redox-sensitive transcriptional activator SoxR